MLLAILRQGVGDVPCLAAAGKDALAALDVELYAETLEKAYRSPVVELGECHVEKIGVGADMVYELLGGACIREIASSLAGNTDLASGLLHFFQKQHRASRACGLGCGHQTCRSRSYDYCVVHDISFNFAQKYKITAIIRPRLQINSRMAEHLPYAVTLSLRAASRIWRRNVHGRSSHRRSDVSMS